MGYDYCFCQIGVPEGQIKVTILYLFQTPHGLLEIDVDYCEDLFKEKLELVQSNYFGQYLVEFFEKRVPRRLPPFNISNKATPTKVTPMKATPTKATPMNATSSQATTSQAMPSSSRSAIPRPRQAIPRPRPTRFSLDEEQMAELSYILDDF